MKLGVSLKINVSEIDKDRLFKGKKGTYLDATVFIDVDNVDEYGNNGMITQDVTKEDREQKKQGPILGNAKVFWKGEGGKKPEHHKPPSEPDLGDSHAPDFDDVPF